MKQAPFPHPRGLHVTPTDRQVVDIDIVERLRGWVPSDFWNRAVGEMRDAAAEIERLRAAGDALVESYAFVVGHPPEATRAIAVWREASREQ